MEVLGEKVIRSKTEFSALSKDVKKNIQLNHP